MKKKTARACRKQDPIVRCCICDIPILREHPRRYPASTSAHRQYAHRDCLESEAAYVDYMLAGSALAP